MGRGSLSPSANNIDTCPNNPEFQPSFPSGGSPPPPHTMSQILHGQTPHSVSRSHEDMDVFIPLEHKFPSPHIPPPHLSPPPPPHLPNPPPPHSRTLPLPPRHLPGLLPPPYRHHPPSPPLPPPRHPSPPPPPHYHHHHHHQSGALHLLPPHHYHNHHTSPPPPRPPPHHNHHPTAPPPPPSPPPLTLAHHQMRQKHCGHCCLHGHHNIFTRTMPMPLIMPAPPLH